MDQIKKEFEQIKTDLLFQRAFKIVFGILVLVLLFLWASKADASYLPNQFSTSSVNSSAGLNPYYWNLGRGYFGSSTIVCVSKNNGADYSLWLAYSTSSDYSHLCYMDIDFPSIAIYADSDNNGGVSCTDISAQGFSFDPDKYYTLRGSPTYTVCGSATFDPILYNYRGIGNGFAIQYFGTSINSFTPYMDWGTSTLSDITEWIPDLPTASTRVVWNFPHNGMVLHQENFSDWVLRYWSTFSDYSTRYVVGRIMYSTSSDFTNGNILFDESPLTSVSSPMGVNTLVIPKDLPLLASTTYYAVGQVLDAQSTNPTTDIIGTTDYIFFTTGSASGTAITTYYYGYGGSSSTPPVSVTSPMAECTNEFYNPANWINCMKSFVVSIGNFLIHPHEQSTDFILDRVSSTASLFPFSIVSNIIDSAKASATSTTGNYDLYLPMPTGAKIAILTSSSLEGWVGSSTKSIIFTIETNIAWLLMGLGVLFLII